MDFEFLFDAFGILWLHFQSEFCSSFADFQSFRPNPSAPTKPFGLDAHYRRLDQSPPAGEWVLPIPIHKSTHVGDCLGCCHFKICDGFRFVTDMLALLLPLLLLLLYVCFSSAFIVNKLGLFCACCCCAVAVTR